MASSFVVNGPTFGSVATSTSLDVLGRRGAFPSGVARIVLGRSLVRDEVGYRYRAQIMIQTYLNASRLESTTAIANEVAGTTLWSC